MGSHRNPAVVQAFCGGASRRADSPTTMASAACDMGQTAKHCPSCNTEKPAAAFNRSVRTVSGLDWQCKVCKAGKLNLVAQRRRDARRKGWHANQLRAREQARAKWGHAGDYSCSVLGCTSQSEHLHHVNYDEPLSVVPLCARHHNEEHTTLKVF